MRGPFLSARGGAFDGGYLVLLASVAIAKENEFVKALRIIARVWAALIWQCYVARG